MISFIIPVYNNASSLKLLHNSLREILNPFPELRYEVIFVNDGSTDNSLDIIKQLRQKDKRIKLISFTKNFGQIPAIMSGLKHYSGDAVILRSADLQDSFDLIPDFIQKWRDGHKIVIGHRKQNTDSLGQRIPSSFFYRLINWVNPEIPQGGYDYCLLDQTVVDILKNFNDKHRFLQADILSLGYRAQFIPYTRELNKTTLEKRALRKRVKYFIDGVLNTSYIPIRMMTYVGVSFATIGVVYSLVIVVARITNNVPFIGWAPLMILLLIIGGLIMIMLGIIGEYLWRIYDEIKSRPEYIIEELDLSDE